MLGYFFALFFQKYGINKTLVFADLTGTVALVMAVVIEQVFKMEFFVFSDALPFNNDIYYPLHPVYAMEGYGVIAWEFIVASLLLRVCRNRIPDFILTLSKNVTFIYVVQWAVIGFLSPVLVSITDIYANIAIALCVLVVSYFGGILLKRTNLIHV